MDLCQQNDVPSFKCVDSLPVSHQESLDHTLRRLKMHFLYHLIMVGRSQMKVSFNSNQDVVVVGVCVPFGRF